MLTACAQNCAATAMGEAPCPGSRDILADYAALAARARALLPALEASVERLAAHVAARLEHTWGDDASQATGRHPLDTPDATGVTPTRWRGRSD